MTLRISVDPNTLLSLNIIYIVCKNLDILWIIYKNAFSKLDMCMYGEQSLNFWDLGLPFCKGNVCVQYDKIKN